MDGMPSLSSGHWNMYTSCHINIIIPRRIEINISLPVNVSSWRRQFVSAGLCDSREALAARRVPPAAPRPFRAGHHLSHPGDAGGTWEDRSFGNCDMLAITVENPKFRKKCQYGFPMDSSESTGSVDHTQFLWGKNPACERAHLELGTFGTPIPFFTGFFLNSRWFFCDQNQQSHLTRSSKVDQKKWGHLVLKFPLLSPIPPKNWSFLSCSCS